MSKTRKRIDEKQLNETKENEGDYPYEQLLNEGTERYGINIKIIEKNPQIKNKLMDIFLSERCDLKKTKGQTEFLNGLINRSNRNRKHTLSTKRDTFASDIQVQDTVDPLLSPLENNLTKHLKHLGIHREVIKSDEWKRLRDIFMLEFWELEYPLKHEGFIHELQNRTKKYLNDQKKKTFPRSKSSTIKEKNDHGEVTELTFKNWIIENNLKYILCERYNNELKTLTYIFHNYKDNLAYNNLESVFLTTIKFRDPEYYFVRPLIQDPDSDIERSLQLFSTLKNSLLPERKSVVKNIFKNFKLRYIRTIYPRKDSYLKNRPKRQYGIVLHSRLKLNSNKSDIQRVQKRSLFICLNKINNHKQFANSHLIQHYREILNIQTQIDHCKKELKSLRIQGNKLNHLKKSSKQDFDDSSNEINSIKTEKPSKLGVVTSYKASKISDLRYQYLFKEATVQNKELDDLLPTKIQGSDYKETLKCLTNERLRNPKNIFLGPLIQSSETDHSLSILESEITFKKWIFENNLKYILNGRYNNELKTLVHIFLNYKKNYTYNNLEKAFLTNIRLRNPEYCFIRPSIQIPNRKREKLFSLHENFKYDSTPLRRRTLFHSIKIFFVKNNFKEFYGDSEQTQLLKMKEEKILEYNQLHQELNKIKKKIPEYEHVTSYKSKLKSFFNINSIGKPLAFFGIFSMCLFLLISSSTLMLTPGLISMFYLIQELIFIIYLFLLLENRILPKWLIIFSLVSPAFLYAGLLFSFFFGLSLFSILLTPIFFVGSTFLIRNRPLINPKDREIENNSFILKYHIHKFVFLWIFVFIFIVFYGFTYFFAPYAAWVPSGLLFLSIILFSIKAKSRIADYLIRKKRESRQKETAPQGPKRYRISFDDKNKRAAALIIVFLVIYPLTFSVSSLVPIQFPGVEFAKVQNEERVASTSVDYSELEYVPNLEELGELSFNDFFVSKSVISPGFLQSAITRIRLIPKDVTELDGYFLKEYYDICSGYILGPQKDYVLYNGVPLNKLNLLPGTYQVKSYYSVFTGFSLGTASSETYELTIGKEDLHILGTEPFENIRLDYNAVYTFHNETLGEYKVIYNGQVLDSLNQPVAVDKLELYVEIYDYFEKIATISTDTDGRFYYEHLIYGDMEIDALAQILFPGNELYHQLDHLEYVGLDENVRNRWFVDANGDNLPDWGYTLIDLLRATAGTGESGSIDSLVFHAELNDGPGNSITYDSTVNNYAGYIEGNTMWTTGKHDSGLFFDGDGITSYSGGFVKSVEHIMITLGSGVTSNYTTLSKNQDTSNCVPFASIKLDTTGDDWDENMIDLFFESSSDNRIVVERGEGSGSVVISVFIVEFDNTKVKVQSGSFSTSDTNIDVSITPVDTSKAVPMAYWKITGNDDDWDCAMVTTDFMGTTAIRMERDQATGTISGHYFVFEALNSEFSVQKVEMSMTTSDDFSTATINTVDMSKSFIIASYEVDERNDDTEEGALDIWLNSATEVRAERRPEANTYAIPTINVFVVTFESSGSSSVQRNSFTWANADTSKQASISQVDLNTAMVKGGTMYGIIKCDGTGSDDPKSSFIQYEFDGSTTVRAERYTSSEDGTGHWEVVEWDVVSISYEDFDYVNWGDILDNDLDGNFTITSWINPSVFNPHQSANGVKNVFFSKGGSIELGVNESGYLDVSLNTDSMEASGQYGTNGAIPIGQWIFICLRFTEGNVDVMIEEQWYYSAIGMDPEPWSGSIGLINGNDLTIGAETNTFSCFTGILDSIRIYNTSLTNIEVEELQFGGLLEIEIAVYKDAGNGNWVPITTLGEVIDYPLISNVIQQEAKLTQCNFIYQILNQICKIQIPKIGC